MRLRCATCGKSVSNEVDNNTIVRAFIECPECIEARKPEMTKEEAYELVESLIQAVVEVDKSSDPNGLWRVDEIRNKIVETLTGKEATNG